jgi:8-oxo-dGTP diphosphatase
LCGFSASENSEIGLRTFWHFRNKYKDIYAELITKILISLVLSGKYPNLGLPFVERINESEFNGAGNLIQWRIDAYRPTITISIDWTEKDLLTEKDREDFGKWKEQWTIGFSQCKDLNEYRYLKSKYDEEYRVFSQLATKSFTEEVRFPIDVFTPLISGEKLFFRLKKPDWLKEDFYLTRTSHNIDEGGENLPRKIKYDKACNILVIREVHGQQEILLSRRKTGRKGRGSFATPGGKQMEGETLEQCAKRELEEETGLTLDQSKPISVYYTRTEDGKQILSIGVLAMYWSGEVETKEPNKHSDWAWHKLNNLPLPIFEFTEKAINQFVDNKYPNLNWEDLEERPDVQLSLFDS